MKKIYIGIVLVILGIILSITGSVLQYKNNKSISKDKTNSTKISGKHCLDGICINSIEIVVESDGMVNLTGTVTNETTNELPQGFVNLVFDVNGKKITKEYFYYYTSPIKEISLEIYNVDKNIAKAKDYKVEKPTDEQLKYYYENKLSLD